jgi:predicted GNAT family N-acyltransferase
MSVAEADTISIVPVQGEAELMQALAIREVVFIEEQRVPEGIERDAEDAKAFHVLAMHKGHAIGTGDW